MTTKLKTNDTRWLRVSLRSRVCRFSARKLRSLTALIHRHVLILFGLPLALAVFHVQASDFVWNNGAGTGLWNVTDANWSGSVWGNSPANSAVFTTVGGTVSLGGSISVGSVTLGNTSFNSPNTTFTGGSLSAANLMVQGYSNNDGHYASNPTLTLDVPAVSVSGDIAVGRASLVVTSGTVTANLIISAVGSADWADIVINGGTVIVTNGVNGSVNTPFTFQMDLNGGALYTPFLKVAAREYYSGNNAWLNFNGTVIHPTADTNSFITLYGGTQNTHVGMGGAVFNTDGHDIGLGVNLVGSGSGGLTKAGLGTLTLSGQNSYLGTTRVQGGVLSFSSSSAVSASSVIDITNGAIVNLNFNGSAAVYGLCLNGVTQSSGVYGAATHPTFFTGAGQLIIPPPFTNALANAGNDGISNFRRMKYGFFVHYVWGGSVYPRVTINSDGSAPAGINDVADRFDAQGFADDLARMQVEYVIFTAWHANMNCLWPSAAMNRWLSGHTSQRDMLGDMIDAVKAKGIRVLLYTHPRDGHDLSLADQVATGWGGPGVGSDPDWNLFDYQKWNDFINDVYGDLLDRYGSRIDGFWLDEGGAPLTSDWAVDYPRLRQTIKSRNPGLIMIENYYGTLYSSDIGQVEYWGGIFTQSSGVWPSNTKPHAVVMASSWSAAQPAGINTVPFSAGDMFRYTVLQAGVNTDGGGVSWAAGPYAGGGWETGVVSTMQTVGAFIQPIRRSICNTLPSQSWVTPAGTTLSRLSGGFVATRSPDDGSEFIHVLNPPTGNSITLPAPADGSGYAAASFLANGHPVTLTRNADSSLTLTLSPGDAWDALDTVIALTSVALNPTNLTVSVSGTNLMLSWSADHTGWTLLVQTNHLNSGISVNTNDWMRVSGSAATNSVVIPILPNAPGGYYRLVYP